MCLILSFYNSSCTKLFQDKFDALNFNDMKVMGQKRIDKGVV